MTVTCQRVASVSHSLVPHSASSVTPCYFEAPSACVIGHFYFYPRCIETYFFMLHAFSSPGLRIVFFCLLLLIHLCEWIPPKLKNTTDMYYLGEFGSVGSRGSSFMQPSGVGESACWPGLRWADGLVGAGESVSKIVRSNSSWKVGVGRRPQLLSLETPEQGSLRTEK